MTDDNNSSFGDRVVHGELEPTTPDPPAPKVPEPPKPASFEELVRTPRKRRYKTVPLPIMGKTLLIRSLLDRELSTYQAETVDRESNFKAGKLEDAQRRLMALCVVDPTSKELMFTPERIGLLGDWDAADTGALFAACTKHVGISAEDIAELVRIRNAGKNFELTHGA